MKRIGKKLIVTEIYFILSYLILSYLILSIKGVLKYFAKFTGKHLCQSLFFNKAAGLRAATLLKKKLWHRSFPVNFVKFLRTPFFTEHLRWLLLDVHRIAPVIANALM